jgi:NAD(P)-dependent dehydrogenase (short-subunit alcohol dehydrogenase family)
MARLAGKVAIIAGAAFGIGRATATIMAREGARVIVGDYDADAAAGAAEAIRGGGGQAQSIHFDATSEDSVRELIAKAKERYGRVDIMHNNVGGTEPGKDVNVVELDVAAWDRILKLTLYSAMYGCRHVVPVMLQTGGGAIVNTASMSGVMGDAGLTAYGAAKAGVISLTRYVATQYGRRNIRCNAIAPGLITTERANEVVAPPVQKIFEEHNLVPRNGRPEDIGHVVAFLASDEAAFITGQTITVDGGAFVHGPTLVDMMKLGLKI